MCIKVRDVHSMCIQCQYATGILHTYIIPSLSFCWQCKLGTEGLPMPLGSPLVSLCSQETLDGPPSVPFCVPNKPKPSTWLTWSDAVFPSAVRGKEHAPYQPLYTMVRLHA